MAAGDPQLTGAHTDRSVLFRLMAAARCFCPPIRPVFPHAVFCTGRAVSQFMDESAAERRAERSVQSPFVAAVLSPCRFLCRTGCLPLHGQNSSRAKSGATDTVSIRAPPFFPHAVFCTRQVLLHFTDESAAGQEQKDRRSSRFRRKCCSNSRFAAPAASLYTTTKLPTRRGREFFLLIRPPGFRQALQFPPVRCRQHPHRRCRHPPGVPSRRPPHER